MNERTSALACVLLAGALLCGAGRAQACTHYGAMNYDGFTRPVSEWICGTDETGKAASIKASALDRWLHATRRPAHWCPGDDDERARDA